MSETWSKFIINELKFDIINQWRIYSEGRPPSISFIVNDPTYKYESTKIL